MLKGSVLLHVPQVTVNSINTIVPCAEGHGFSCMFCQLLSILSKQFYRVLKDIIQLHVLIVTVNRINTILPCAGGQDSAACSAGYCQSYQNNCTVC